MKLRDQVGLNIQRIRRARGISQEALAHNAGVNRGYIGKLENAKFAASLDMVERIASALNISAAELLIAPVSLKSNILETHSKKRSIQMTKSSKSNDGKATKPRRLKAQPFREGVIFTQDETVIVWKEYAWDTGEVIRYWAEGFETVPEHIITIRKIDRKD